MMFILQVVVIKTANAVEVAHGAENAFPHNRVWTLQKIIVVRYLKIICWHVYKALVLVVLMLVVYSCQGIEIQV